LATEYKTVGPERGFAVGEALQESKQLLAAFSRASAVGFAVLDDELRYQAINNCLASINGLPAKAHLGFTVREIFGELAEKTARPNYDRVLANGEISHFETTDAVLPTRTDSHYWGLNYNFPIRNHVGRVTQIGIVVIETTEQRKLEKSLHELAGELHTMTRFASALQEAIEEYHIALVVNLAALVRGRERSTELLAQSVEVLDQRIRKMRRLVSSVTSNLPSDI
jgi:PAS domain S-box-containing protein